MGVKIGEITKKLEACVAARSAIDAAARAVKDAQILVDQAKNAVGEAEEVMKVAAEAAEAAVEEKVKAAVALEKGVEDLMKAVLDAKSINKGNALDTCLAAREFINTAATKAHHLRAQAESAAQLADIKEAALSTAQSAWTERKRVYENMVSNANSAKNSIMDVARIIRS